MPQGSKGTCAHVHKPTLEKDFFFKYNKLDIHTWGMPRGRSILLEQPMFPSP